MAPQLLQVRCPCGSLYLVYCGGGDAAAGEKERAGAMGARFVDARLEPCLLCGCGQDLDFTIDEGPMIQ